MRWLGVDNHVVTSLCVGMLTLHINIYVPLHNSWALKWDKLLNSTSNKTSICLTHIYIYSYERYHLLSFWTVCSKAYSGQHQRIHQCFSLLALCAGKPQIISRFPTQRPVVWKDCLCYDGIIHFLSESEHVSQISVFSIHPVRDKWSRTRIKVHIVFCFHEHMSYICCSLCWHGPLTRYVQLWVAHALWECRERFPATDFKGNRYLTILACITARASRTSRDARRDRKSAVTYVARGPWGGGLQRCIPESRINQSWYIYIVCY